MFNLFYLWTIFPSDLDYFVPIVSPYILTSLVWDTPADRKELESDQCLLVFMAQVYVYDLSRHFPPKPTFLKVGKEINRGAYGAVYEGEIKGRPVAVKKIHRILQEASHNEGTIDLFDNFKKECSLLEKAEHVHVVQFHGAFYDEESHEPILVMERMHENLLEYLSKNQGKLSLSRQLQICLEIAEGVHFLHSLVPPVIHRDLNDKNVMLTKEGQVKIGDLGQSRLKDVNKDYFSTGQPGAVPFMPPEALQDTARYNEKIDTFSVGVLMLEVATQQSPQVRLVGIGTTSELKRREKDLAKLPGDHPMRPLILNCLKDKPQKRPDITTLMNKLQTMIKVSIK